MPSPLPDPDPSAFSFDGDGPAALVIHGFSGSAYEVLPLGIALAEAGYHVHGPLLPGHGTSLDDFANTAWTSWTHAVEDAFLALPSDRPRFVIGGSMGGLLALHLAHRFDEEIAATAVMAPALQLHPLGEAGMVLAKARFEHVMRYAKKSDPGGDCFDDEGRQKNPCYEAMPVKALRAFNRLRNHVRSRVGSLSHPLWVGHGIHDATVSDKAARWLVRNIRAPRVETRWYENSKHLLCLDRERDDVISDIVAFCERHRTTGRSP